MKSLPAQIRNTLRWLAWLTALLAATASLPLAAGEPEILVPRSAAAPDLDGSLSPGEWGADELLDDLARKHGFEAIAVGIDNGEQRRMQELNPWDHERFGKGEGFAYLRFLVETVKPYIDANYRSRTEAASTALIGSSMGGLITQAALHRHREVFGLGGVFSPAFWTARQAAYLLTESEPLLASQRVFIYAGGREDRDMVPLARRMLDLVRAQTPHVQFVEEPEAGHN